MFGLGWTEILIVAAIAVLVVPFVRINPTALRMRDNQSVRRLARRDHQWLATNNSSASTNCCNCSSIRDLVVRWKNSVVTWSPISD